MCVCGEGGGGGGTCVWVGARVCVWGGGGGCTFVPSSHTATSTMFPIMLACQCGGVDM